LFKKHGSIFPQKIYDSIKDIHNGAKRARAQEKVDGRVPMEERKAAIPGHLYFRTDGGADASQRFIHFGFFGLQLVPDVPCEQCRGFERSSFELDWRLAAALDCASQG
jgi:hypothetical protein